MFEKRDVSVNQGCGLTLADQSRLKGLETLHHNVKDKLQQSKSSLVRGSGEGFTV